MHVSAHVQVACCCWAPVGPDLDKSEGHPTWKLQCQHPLDGASDEAFVGPYGSRRRSTNDNGLWLLDLCSGFDLVLTNTPNNIKTKDI